MKHFALTLTLLLFFKSTLSRCVAGLLKQTVIASEK